MPCWRSGSVAIVGKPASAMRCGNSAITVRCPALSMPCRRDILRNVRPRPKQGPVLGSIMQTAIHGVSLFIQTKDPGAKPRSSPFQRCHDWINIVSTLGDHRFLELLVQTGAGVMLLDLAQKKGRNSEASAGYRRRDRLLSNSCRTDTCQVRSGERSALLCV
jgi:hypothetical protein